MWSTCLLIPFIVHVTNFLAHVYPVRSEAVSYAVSDVSCVITQKSWIIPDRLVVRWRLPGTVNVTDVNVHWVLGQNRGVCSQSDLNSCTCLYGDVNCMDFNSFFQLHVTFEGHVASLDFDADKCRKPPKLDNINVHAINSTCLDVSWWYGVTTFCSDNDARVYQLSYRGDPEMNWKNVTLARTKSCNGTKVLCDLDPYTVYHVTVMCKFTDYKGNAIGHWSDPAVSNATTLQSVPTGAPGVVPGGFYHVHEDCLHDDRTVRLYWQPLVPADRNGVITEYYIGVLPRPRSTRSTNQKLVRPGTALSVDLDLHCSVNYTVTLGAATAVGVSHSSSHIAIPNISHGAQPEVVDVIPIETGTNTLTALWKLNQGMVDNGTSILVIWCLKDSHATCKGSPEWQTVPGGSTQLTISPATRQPLHHYMVGVSAGNQGITWTECLFAKDKVPPRPVEVNVRPLGSDHALSVSWENSPCEARMFGPYIDHFLVQMCPVAMENDKICSGHVISANVGHDEASYLTYDLDPDYLYKVNVIAIGRDDTKSNPSYGVYARVPARKGSFNKDLVILAISLLVIVISLVVAVGLIVRKVRQRGQLKQMVYTNPLVESELANLTKEDGMVTTEKETELQTTTRLHENGRVTKDNVIDLYAKSGSADSYVSIPLATDDEIEQQAATVTAEDETELQTATLITENVKDLQTRSDHAEPYVSVSFALGLKPTNLTSGNVKDLYATNPTSDNVNDSHTRTNSADRPYVSVANAAGEEIKQHATNITTENDIELRTTNLTTQNVKDPQTRSDLAKPYVSVSFATGYDIERKPTNPTKENVKDLNTSNLTTENEIDLQTRGDSAGPYVLASLATEDETELHASNLTKLELLTTDLTTEKETKQQTANLSKGNIIDIQTPNLIIENGLEPQTRSDNVDPYVSVSLAM